MKPKLEHRSCLRFTIPGAAVSYRKVGFWRRDHGFPDVRYPVADLGKGGLSFFTNNPPELESRVAIALILPKNETAAILEGKIIYSIPRGAGLSSRFRVGVEFAPFAERRGFNSLRSLDVLDKLEAIYAAGNEVGCEQERLKPAE